MTAARDIPIAILKYSEVDFIWVASHWDIHLSGLCKYRNQLCRFETNEETEICAIYTLSSFEKIRWIIRKKRFEFCVGYHWTYPQRKNDVHFYYRNPQWLYKILFKLHYALKLK